MAHVLHSDDNHHDGSDRDFSGSSGHSGDCTGDASDCRKRKRRRHRCHYKWIPVGSISIDCATVTYRTPGQAHNLVTCAMTQTLTVPVSRTVFVQEPTDFGCFVCRPVTETVQVPVTATVSVPPTLVPVPRIVCPETILCPQFCPTTVNVRSCGCK